MRQSSLVATVNLGEKVHATSSAGNVCVVCTTGRDTLVYDVRKLEKEYKKIESPLKYQNRCVVLFDETCYAIGSIEGRVAIQHIEDSFPNKNFAFKCHRTEKDVYPVNSICVNPKYGTFSTAGSDGTFGFWDKESKQRLRSFRRCNAPISCSAFNGTGSLFAYAVSYDWSTGIDGVNAQTLANNIILRTISDDEVKKRS